MPSSVELAEAKTTAITAAKQLLDKADSEDRELTTDEYETWHALNKQIDDLGSQITKTQRRETIEAWEAEQQETRPRKGNRAAATQQFSEREVAQVWRAWALRRANSPDIQFRAAEYGLPINQAEVEFTLTTFTPTSGKEWVGATYLNQVEEAIKYYLPLTNYIHQYDTAGGESVFLFTADDTANMAVEVGENQSVEGVAKPITGRVESTVKKWRTGQVPITQEELEDSRVDIPSYLARAFGERFARRYAVEATNAMIAGADPGGSLASGNALTVAKLYDFYFGLDQGFTTSPKFAIMMHQTTFAQIAQMTDGDGRLLFPDIQSVLSKRLLGAPVLINNNMPSIADADPGDTLILMGDFDRFWWRRAGDMRRIVRYDQYPGYVELDCVVFQGFERSGFFYRYPAQPGIVALTAYAASSMAMNFAPGEVDDPADALLRRVPEPPAPRPAKPTPVPVKDKK